MSSTDPILAEHQRVGPIVRLTQRCRLRPVESYAVRSCAAGRAACKVATASLRSSPRPVLGLVALFCLGFAVLDRIEMSRKWGDETTIAVLALLALVLHAAAGAVAAASAQRLTRRGAIPPP